MGARFYASRKLVHGDEMKFVPEETLQQLNERLKQLETLLRTHGIQVPG